MLSVLSWFFHEKCCGSIENLQKKLETKIRLFSTILKTSKTPTPKVIYKKSRSSQTLSERNHTVYLTLVCLSYKPRPSTQGAKSHILLQWCVLITIVGCVCLRSDSGEQLSYLPNGQFFWVTPCRTIFRISTTEVHTPFRC
jgi:hypothetical protein